MKKCFFCGTEQNIETHHVYFGAKRKTADQNGFVVPLCMKHHRGNGGVHKQREVDLLLKRHCQREYEKQNSRESFIKLIGRNYL